MRDLLRAAPIALALLTALSLPARAQGLKVAYVQTSVLLDQAPGRAEAEAQFDKETGTYRDQIKRMSDSLNAMVADFQKRSVTLTAAARETQGKGIQAKEAEYQRRTQELEQKAQGRQNELVQPILDKIKGAIEEVRVEGGYAMIFNADQGSPIVAVDKSLNVTDRVLTKLKGTTAAAPAPRPSAATPAPSGVTRPNP
ncbi:MAG: OmpH family outer membrane protein [Gemmatimonadaceae bacterium]